MADPLLISLTNSSASSSLKESLDMDSCLCSVGRLSWVGCSGLLYVIESDRMVLMPCCAVVVCSVVILGVGAEGGFGRVGVLVVGVVVVVVVVNAFDLSDDIIAVVMDEVVVTVSA